MRDRFWAGNRAHASRQRTFSPRNVQRPPRWRSRTGVTRFSICVRRQWSSNPKATDPTLDFTGPRRQGANSVVLSINRIRQRVTRSALCPPVSAPHRTSLTADVTRRCRRSAFNSWSASALARQVVGYPKSLRIKRVGTSHLSWRRIDRAVPPFASRLGRLAPAKLTHFL